MSQRENPGLHSEHAPAVGLYWPGSDDGPRRVYGLGGPDPTAP